MNRENMSQLLTKSKFLEGVSCAVKLYYSSIGQYASNKEKSEFSEGLKKGGFQVGELAKQYFDDGIQIETRSLDEGHAQTLELLKKQDTIIFEAVIINDKFLVKPDILEKIGDTINLIEVKSKSVSSAAEDFFTKRGDKILSGWKSHILDIAFQTFVMKEIYPDYTIVPYLMLVDKSKKTTIDGLNQMFKMISVGESNQVAKFIGSKDQLGDEILCKINVTSHVDFVMEEMDFDGKKFIEMIEDLQVINRDHTKPVVKIGSKCKKCQYRVNPTPENSKNGYEECWMEYLNWSHDEFDKAHIFDIWKINARDLDKMLNNRIYLLEDIDLNSWGSGITKDRQRLQISTTLKGDNSKNNEIIDPNLFEEMKQWQFPLHFIDFETTVVALPFTKNKRPYELIVFQFSIHDVDENGLVTHSADWLNTAPGIFPNFDLVRKLKAALSKDEGTIFCYSPYENNVLNTIHDQIYDQREQVADSQDIVNWIRTITYWKEGKERFEGDRCMVDMLKLVMSYYYHPLMKGSNGIKDVLPTVFAISDFIQQKYQTPYQNSRNFGENQIWYQLDDGNGYPINPYDLLTSDEDNEMGKYVIKQGGEAMAAYGKLQFTEMEEDVRKKINQFLLKYCELDTLAMVMIYEHWKSLLPK